MCARAIWKSQRIQPASVSATSAGTGNQKRVESEVVEGCRGQERGAKPAYRLVSSTSERKVSLPSVKMLSRPRPADRAAWLCVVDY